MDPRYYKPTQILNTLTSAIGFALSLPGLVLLIRHASQHGNGWHLTSFAIYGASLVISYAAFAFYHVFKFHECWGTFFKILDHSTIYLLIAGTYTPFTLVTLRGRWGWTLFATVWGVTVLGVFFKIFYVHRFKIVAPLTYLFMGWLIVLAIRPAMELIPWPGLQLLFAGGCFYSFGLVFYAWKKLLFHHAIWHLFVLAGSICHYFAVYAYVIFPAGG
ncbi:MAG: hemolysin III family protein [Desulfuromonadaceae bacterium]|nr:hemolysin III family protein [Desulfuromonadaceae bacterium]